MYYYTYFLKVERLGCWHCNELRFIFLFDKLAGKATAIKDCDKHGRCQIASFESCKCVS
jgi:hypothetical protein